MYFCKTPRIYVLTRQERDSGVYVCPHCGKILKKDNLSKSEKIFTCKSCRFRITGRDILPEYPNQKVVVDIGIELKKVAKEIVSVTNEERDPFGFAKGKAHQIFNKAQKVNNNTLKWRITTEKQDEDHYTFEAYPENKDIDAVISVRVTKGKKNFLNVDIPQVSFSIFVRFGEDFFSIQTSNIHSVKALFDKILRTDFSKLLSVNSNNLKEVKDFIKNRFRLTPDDEDGDSISYATRDHGDVGEETPGKEDIELIKSVVRETKQKFPNLKFRPEIIDEWVHLGISLS